MPSQLSLFFFVALLILCATSTFSASLRGHGEEKRSLRRKLETQQVDRRDEQTPDPINQAILKQSVMPVCESWCWQNPTKWRPNEGLGKCSYRACNDCSPCVPGLSLHELPCESWCENNSHPWFKKKRRRGKCSWTRCAGCDLCVSEEPDAATPIDPIAYDQLPLENHKDYACPENMGRDTFRNKPPSPLDCSCCKDVSSHDGPCCNPFG